MSGPHEKKPAYVYGPGCVKAPKSIKCRLKRMFWPEPDPITHETVEPADGLPDKEAEVRSAMNEMSETILRLANRSVGIRERLADETIRIVTGGH